MWCAASFAFATYRPDLSPAPRSVRRRFVLTYRDFKLLPIDRLGCIQDRNSASDVPFNLGEVSDHRVLGPIDVVINDNGPSAF
jgi:hypothetical protein